MNKSNQYPKENPLYKYYIEVVKETAGQSRRYWDVVHERTGIPKQTLYSIARLDKSRARNLSLSTYCNLKEKIGVDMLEYELLIN